MTRDRLRIAFVVHVMQVAGAEILVAEIVRRLRDEIEPVVLCLDAVGPLGERLRGEGVKVVCVNRRPGLDWTASARIADLLERRRIEVVHAHQYGPFFHAAIALMRLAARRTAVRCRPAREPGLRGSKSAVLPRLIFTEHGRHFPDRVSPRRRAVNRAVLDPLASAVNAVCGFSARALCRCDGFAGKRIEVLPNGIDLERYPSALDRQALRRRLGLDLSRRYVVHVARFHPVKDQATLLRAFAQTCRHCDDVDLLLLGDGELRRSIEDLADSLDVRGRVRFLGVRDDVPAWLGAADLFALSSLSEAASLTLLEAMASRLPVVATNVGGTPELCRHEREGLLSPRGDAEALADAMIRLLDAPHWAQRLGEAGRQRVAAHFQLDAAVRRHAAVYQRVAPPRRVPAW